MNRTLTILHISDLHISAAIGKNTIQQTVFERFKDYLAEWANNENEQNPQLIMVTGDIAKCGKMDEYFKMPPKGSNTLNAWSFFDEIRKIFKLDFNRICTVPGNHDVDRDLVNEFTSIAHLNLLKNEDQLYEIFFGDGSAEGQRNEIFRRLLPYCKFNAKIRGFKPSKKLNAIYNMLYSPIIFKKNKTFPCNIYIAPLCTSWMCQSYFFAYKADKAFINSNYEEPEHQIALCLPKVEQDIYNKISTKEHSLVISLMHHPFNWLVDSEREVAKNVIGKRSDIILSGHNHLSDIFITDISMKSHIIGCGSLYLDKQYRNSFNIIRFEFSNSKPILGYLKVVEWNALKEEWIDANLNINFSKNQKAMGYNYANNMVTFPICEKAMIANRHKTIYVNTFYVNEDKKAMLLKEILRILSKDEDCSFIEFENDKKTMLFSIRPQHCTILKNVLMKSDHDNLKLLEICNVNYIKIDNVQYDCPTNTNDFNFIDDRRPMLAKEQLQFYDKGTGDFWSLTSNSIEEILKIRCTQDVLAPAENKLQKISSFEELTAKKPNDNDDWSWYANERIYGENVVQDLSSENELYRIIKNYDDHDSKKVILVHGGTGHGKTTFLRYFFRKHLKEKDIKLWKKLNVIRISLGIAGLTIDSLEDDVDNKINQFLNTRYSYLYDDKYMYEMAQMSANLKTDFYKRLVKKTKMGKSSASKLRWINSLVGRKSIQRKCNNPFADFNRIRIDYLSLKKQLRFVIIFDNIDQMPYGIQEAAFMLARHKLEWVQDTKKVIIIIAFRNYMLMKAAKELPISAYQDRFEIKIAPSTLQCVLKKRLPYVEKKLDKIYSNKHIFIDNHLFQSKGGKIKISKAAVVNALNQWVDSLGSIKSNLSFYKLTNGDLREQLKMVKDIFRSPNIDWIKLASFVGNTPTRMISESKIIDLLVRETNALCSHPNFFINMFDVFGNQHFANTLNKLFILQIIKSCGNITKIELIRDLRTLGHPEYWTIQSINELLENNIIVSPEGSNYQDVINLYFKLDSDTLGDLYLNTLTAELYYLQAMSYITPLLSQYRKEMELPDKADHENSLFTKRVKSAAILIRQIEYDEQLQLSYAKHSNSLQILNKYNLSGNSKRICKCAVEQLMSIKKTGAYPSVKWHILIDYFRYTCPSITKKIEKKKINCD